MKKKILVFLICCAMFGCVATGCDYKDVENVEEAEKSDSVDSSSMFVCIEETGSWAVVYHKETKVMYAVSEGSYNHGTFTMLVNADGTPMVWEK